MPHLDYQRLDDLLNYLISQHTPITIETLAKVLHVSVRTLRTDIKLINDYISDHGATVDLLRKEGVILNYQNKETFDKFWAHEDKGTFLFTSANERLAFLLRVFLTKDEFISQKYLTDIFFVSQNTLYNDLRRLRDVLKPYDLVLKNKSNIGYKLSGSEYNFRTAIVNLIFQDNLHEFLTSKNESVKDVCNNVDFKLFSNIFYNYFDNLGEEASDFFEKNIFSYIILSLSRIKNKHYLKNFSCESVNLSKKYQELLSSFFNDIEKILGIRLLENEKKYILFTIIENFPAIINESKISEKNEILANQIVTELTTNLSESVHSSWVFDQKLIQNLKNHILRMLNIQIIKGNRVNPIIESVKNNFPYAFDLAIAEMQKIEKNFDLTFSEDEISYIALYIEEAIEKHKDDITDQSVIAIVCGTGYTLSSIIESKLKRKYSNAINKIIKLSYGDFINMDHSEYDFIISTIPISNIPNLYYFDISNFERSFEMIDSIIKSSNSQKNFQIFNSKHINIFKKSISKENLLKKMTSDLIKDGYVTNNFFYDVLKREDVSNTLLDNTIAIPHPINQANVKESIISVAIIPKGVKWNNNTKVKFVFLFAINSKDIKQVEYIYEKILDFISSYSDQELLLKEPNIVTLNQIFSQ